MSGAATAARPRGSDAVLVEAWASRPGVLGWLTAVNHKSIGMRFIVTSFVFLLVGGVIALLMRTQLAAPENDVLSAQGFNEAFTLHGTTMMFLFAVPMVEGLGMYLMPLMLGTRDLPFPRLNAFGYWCYLFGGLLFFSSLAFGDPPDAGWFAYVPLSGPDFAPGSGMDFWLLGITFVEIAGIIGAVELLSCFFLRRAPGMTLNRIPVFAWAIVVTAAMMAFAFPALVIASVLLELDRGFGTRFYDPAAGGDPLLWQHLFWFFGHPEVYILLLPATGIISMVVPTFSRRALAGYPYVVAALVSIGLISFGLWIHHMFTTGISLLGLSFFAAASFLIVIPSGVQIFAWLTTMWRGRPAFRTPMLFVLGFVLTFLLGGITGVMVAAVPFDWQVHDTYFVVAHFHYVLIGGVVFPIFGGLYYWFPKWTGRVLGEGLGQASFWTMLVGFNVAFFPQHIAGLDGMVRRVYTYRASDGWDELNLVSTLGAYVLAAGIALTLVNMVRAWRRPPDAGPNPWDSGSLEWATDSPPQPYGFRELPVVDRAEPLWGPPGEDEREAAPGTREVVAQLADPPAPVREVFETSAVYARPRRVVHLPGPSLWPLVAAALILLSLVGVLLSSAILGVGAAALAVAVMILWAADTVREAPLPAGIERPLPVWTAAGGWWGTVFGGLVVLALLGSLLFAYVLLATDAATWPPPGVDGPPWLLPVLAAVAGAGATVLAHLALAAVRRRGHSGEAGDRRDARAAAVPLAGAAVLALAMGALAGGWLAQAGAAPGDDAYGSIVYAVVVFEVVLAGALAIVLGLSAWHAAAGHLDASRHVTLYVARTSAAIVLATWIAAAGTVLVGGHLG